MVEITSVRVDAPSKFYKQEQFAVAIDVTFASPATQIEEITVCFYVDNDLKWCMRDKVYINERAKGYLTAVQFDAPGTHCFKAVVNGIESNTVCTEIIDLRPFGVADLTPLQADKTAVVVGETVTFFHTVRLTRPVMDVDYEIIGKEWMKIGMCIYLSPEHLRPDVCSEQMLEVGKIEYYLEVKYTFKQADVYRIQSVIGIRGDSVFDGWITVTVTEPGKPPAPQPTPTVTEEQVPDYIINFLIALLLSQIL